MSLKTRVTMVTRTPKLPKLLERKIYKSGQTRGADDDEIFQNRVGRDSTALIRYDLWVERLMNTIENPDSFFERGYIVLIPAETYFSWQSPEFELSAVGLEIGRNALVFYQTREEWDAHNPHSMKWQPATSRTSPLGGQYVARIHATTAYESGERIAEGFTTTGMKGAGIRVYEYASKQRMNDCRLQLEAIFWLCVNSIEAVVDYGMTAEEARARKTFTLKKAKEQGLLDYEHLRKVRILNAGNVTICPLCLEPLDAFGFFNRKAQAKGRETADLTITELNLFHIEELRPGLFNHRPYNLGWGHHLCNVVIGDEGIDHTVRWMHDVVARNVEYYGIKF